VFGHCGEAAFADDLMITLMQRNDQSLTLYRRRT